MPRGRCDKTLRRAVRRAFGIPIKLYPSARRRAFEGLALGDEF